MRLGRTCALSTLICAVSALSCAPGGDAGKGATVAPDVLENNPPPGTGGSTSVDPDDPTNIFDDDDDLGCTNGCAFPSDPIFDEGVTAADVGTAFDDPEAFQAGSLCVVEPQLSGPNGEPGTLLPRNWLRPRFRWVSNGGETLWEIRLKNESQPSELRAYTRNTQWILPDQVWKRMADVNTPVTVTIRGLGPGGVLTGMRGDFQVAPVDAGGSMVFWATTSSLVTREPLSSKLQGFTVGDEAVVQTLAAPQVQTTNIPGENGALPRGYYACGGEESQMTPCAAGQSPLENNCCQPTGFQLGQVECIGCHVSTPDGKAVLFTDNWPWNKVAASIEPATVGALPATVTPYAANLLKQPWLGMQALSPAFFNETQRILITSYGQRGNPGTQPFSDMPPQRHSLAWFDLAAVDPGPGVPYPEEFPEENPYGEVLGQRQTAVGRSYNTAWGLLTTLGENANAVTPSWSNDGATIAYVSTDKSSTDGHPDWTANTADIKVVPYANHTGGNAVPLPGASDPNFLEYYPEFSAGDAFIAFARAPNPSNPSRCVPTQDAAGVVTPCPPQDLGENPDGPYYNRNGEIWIVDREGTKDPIRLMANDPVSCTGETSRGSINSWPKWSPRRENANGKTYYFLIFSSARSYPGSFELQRAPLTPAVLYKSSQLYMAPIVVDDATGNVTTYPAVYLWNQNIVVDGSGEARIENSSNLTPAWDDFSIPPVPPPIRIPA